MKQLIIALNGFKWETKAMLDHITTTFRVSLRRPLDFGNLDTTSSPSSRTGKVG